MNLIISVLTEDTSSTLQLLNNFSSCITEARRTLTALPLPQEIAENRRVSSYPSAPSPVVTHALSQPSRLAAALCGQRRRPGARCGNAATPVPDSASETADQLQRGSRWTCTRLRHKHNGIMGLMAGKCYSTARLDGKTAVVTGCNTGIGLCTVEDFVRRGARVVMACRDLNKAEAAAAGVRERAAAEGWTGSVRVVRLDLSSLGSVRACAAEILNSEPQLHLLINNAGIMACPEMRTEDGFEMQFGTNHLGHFLLTCLLLPRLRASAPARIVVVSSIAHTAGRIDFEDLNWKKDYNPTLAYARSKLANILFAKELGKRLEGTGVTSYSLHPGVVATELGRHFDSAYFKGVTWMFQNIGKYVIKTPEQGAQTTIYCAVSENVENETGFYYSDCKKITPHHHASNDSVATRLWEESAKMVNLGDWNPFTSPNTPDFLLVTSKEAENSKETL